MIRVLCCTGPDHELRGPDHVRPDDQLRGPGDDVCADDVRCADDLRLDVRRPDDLRCQLRCQLRCSDDLRRFVRHVVRRDVRPAGELRVRRLASIVLDSKATLKKLRTLHENFSCRLVPPKMLLSGVYLPQKRVRKRATQVRSECSENHMS